VAQIHQPPSWPAAADIEAGQRWPIIVRPAGEVLAGLVGPDAPQRLITSWELTGLGGWSSTWSMGSSAGFSASCSSGSPGVVLVSVFTEGEDLGWFVRDDSPCGL
jgi:hypothetical protein